MSRTNFPFNHNKKGNEQQQNQQQQNQQHQQHQHHQHNQHLHQQLSEEMLDSSQYAATYPFLDVFDDTLTGHLGSSGGNEFKQSSVPSGYGGTTGMEGPASKRSRLNAHDAASASAAAIGAMTHDIFAPNPLPTHFGRRNQNLGGGGSNFGGSGSNFGGGVTASEINSLQQQLFNMQNAIAMQSNILAAAKSNRSSAAASALGSSSGSGDFLHSSVLQQNPFAQTALSSIYASQRTAASLSAAAQLSASASGAGSGNQQGMSNDPYLSSAFNTGQSSGFFGMQGSQASGNQQSGDFRSMIDRHSSDVNSSGFNNLQAFLGQQQTNLGSPNFLGMDNPGNFNLGRTSMQNPSRHDPFDMTHAHQQFAMHGDMESIPDISAQLKKLKRKQAASTNRQEMSPSAAAVATSTVRKFEGKWGERLQQLLAYKEVHGDCLVPDGYVANPKLARWVREQRGQFKNLRDGKPSHMTEERMAALNELGFTWSLREKVDWKDRFEELVDYKCKHGDCLVPTNYAPNAQLGTWVANQRKHYRLMKEGKRSIMTPERVALLDRIGFQWSIRPSGSRKAKRAP